MLWLCLFFFGYVILQGKIVEEKLEKVLWGPFLAFNVVIF